RICLMKSHTLCFTCLSVVFLALGTAAIAGSEPLEKTVAPAPPAEIDWAGPYIGVNVGAAWTHYDASRYATDVDLEDQFYEAVPHFTGVVTDIATFRVDGRSATETDAIGGGQL